jgi:hypothetical protein
MKYFCREGLDSPNQIEPAQQIKFYAHAIFQNFRGQAKRPLGKSFD